VLLIGIGISYAYWQLILRQEDMNIVNTECFQINFSESEGINLSNAHPTSDAEGLVGVPYDFTITNICNNRASYQINLETLVPDGKQLPDKYLKINLMNDHASIITTKLLSEMEVEPVTSEAVKAYKLLEGTLSPEEEKKFYLRIWMHSDVDSMNATYQGKVSIITSYMNSSMMIMGESIPLVNSGNGLYGVSHEDANITFIDDTEVQNRLKQTEYRYAGPNPNNYVRFNNELWRMIGLVNTPQGLRVKMIRNEMIDSYSWDSSASSINNGKGINEWSGADLMELLNHGPYYLRTSGICYNGVNNATIACDFSESGLMDESKNMIDTITWNLGSNDGVIYTYSNTNTIDFYHQERSKNTGKICSSGDYCTDQVLRTVAWNGNVGLMYPSDYGYATSGGSEVSRSACLNKELYRWNDNAVSDCKLNSWIYDSSNFQWTLTSLAYFVYANAVLCVLGNGSLDDNDNNARAVRPSVYLRSNIKITSGDGTIESPYELSF